MRRPTMSHAVREGLDDGVGDISGEKGAFQLRRDRN